ncbi:MAG: DUF935 family protein [Candidatus Riflebacteria bacterium]|nr:DUF935 family protein [Candidatus Riflebacteria bacterium]
MVTPIAESEKVFISEKEAISASINGSEMLPVFARREEAWDFYSFLGLLPDPDPVLSKMEESAEILESLMADSHLTSVAQTRKNGTLSVECDFTPGSIKDKDPDVRSKRIHSAFVEDMENLELREIMSQLLDAIFYGFVPVEIMWKASGGMFRINGLRPLPFRWFSFDNNNTPVFLSQKAPISGLPLPPGKFLLARNNSTFDNPFGNRLLSRCFWPVYFKRGGLKFWVRFLEKFAGIFLVGKTPNMNQSTEMFNNLRKMVQNAVAVIPEGSEVDVIQGNVGGTTDAYERFKTAMDSEISKVILGQTLTTEVGDRGTQALGTVHKEILEAYNKSDQAMVKNFFDSLAWIYCQVNDSSALSPRFVWKYPEETNTELAQRDKTLSDVGLEFSKEYFVRKYGFMDGDIKITKKQATQIPQNNRQFPGQNFSEANFPDQEAIDKFINSIPSGKLTNFTDKALKPVIGMIEKGASYEEVIGKITEIYPDMNTDQLEETMARAIFVSDVYGRLSAAKGK